MNTDSLHWRNGLSEEQTVKAIVFGAACVARNYGRRIIENIALVDLLRMPIIHVYEHKRGPERTCVRDRILSIPENPPGAGKEGRNIARKFTRPGCYASASTSLAPPPFAAALA